MANTSNVLIDQIHRLPNSVNGNPRYLVETDRGPKFTLADSSSWQESFATMFSENFDLDRVLNIRAILTIDRGGYIIGFAPVPTPGTPAVVRLGKFASDRDEELYRAVSEFIRDEDWEFGDAEEFGVYVWRYSNEAEADGPTGHWLIFHYANGSVVCSWYPSEELARADFEVLRKQWTSWCEVQAAIAEAQRP